MYMYICMFDIICNFRFGERILDSSQTAYYFTEYRHRLLVMALPVDFKSQQDA